MALKKIGFIFALFVVFSIIFFVFQKDSFTMRSFSTQANKTKVLKNRNLRTGQPQLIKNKKSDLSNLNKYIEKQWALKNISILPAWKILEEKTKNQPVVVAIVDTGIHTKHPCLKNKLWVNKKEIPNNGKDDDNNGFVDDIHGWNFVNNNNDIQDSNGHGTHVSGIIAAQGASPDSPSCEIRGVAPHVQIMTLKYFDSGAEDDNIRNTIKSIEYAVDNGADIINYSGGGPGANTDEKTAIIKAGDKGIIFVAALGNEGSKIGQQTKYYPASYELPNILFVQSQNENNEIIESSNRIQLKPLEDKQVHTAPGEHIISTLPPQIYFQGNLKAKIFRSLASYSINHNRYGYMTGTSQATAVATGVVALVKTLYPSWSMEKQINQVVKTGYGQGTEKIKAITNQGKKLSAEQALIMRGQNVDSSDQIDNTNTIIPHDPSKIDSILKRPINSRRLMEEPDVDSVQEIENINKILNK